MFHACFRLLGRLVVALAFGFCLAGLACDADAAFKAADLKALDDSPSEAARFVGIWDIHDMDGEPRHIVRLICDETGDPRQLQGFGDSLPGLPSDVLAEFPTGDCRLIHGSPSPAWCLLPDGILHGAADGRAYAASARAWQEDDRLLVEVLVEVQDASGALHKATLNLDLSFAGEPAILDDEMNSLLEEFDFFASSFVQDAARGTLAVSASAGDASQSEPIRVVALRPQFY